MFIDRTHAAQYKRECGLMNANGTWPHAPHHFISEHTRTQMTSFWQAMQRHAQEHPDWEQRVWAPLPPSLRQGKWSQCQIQNWDYQWFFDQTHRAPRWQDLPSGYKQWWMYTCLPRHRGPEYYLKWMTYEKDEYERKQRQLQRMQDEWDGLSQLTKMQYFDPLIPTESVHAAKWQVGDAVGVGNWNCKSRANPYNVRSF